MYLPELANVESKFIHEPWEMSPAQQRIAGVEIGKQYPAPITDHATARAITLEIYQAATR
jgi:deoxyribodipyrimidine photo-lyase